jgi:hypothetical protein
LAPGHGPAVLLPDGGVLLLRGETLLYRQNNGTEQVVQAAGIVTLSRMDGEWVHARTESGRNLAVRLATDMRAYDLPEASQ